MKNEGKGKGGLKAVTQVLCSCITDLGTVGEAKVHRTNSEVRFEHATFDFSGHIYEEMTKWQLDITASGPLRNDLDQGYKLVSHLYIPRW